MAVKSPLPQEPDDAVMAPGAGQFRASTMRLDGGTQPTAEPYDPVRDAFDEGDDDAPPEQDLTGRTIGRSARRIEDDDDPAWTWAALVIAVAGGIAAAIFVPSPTIEAQPAVDVIILTEGVR